MTIDVKVDLTEYFWNKIRSRFGHSTDSFILIRSAATCLNRTALRSINVASAILTVRILKTNCIVFRRIRWEHEYTRFQLIVYSFNHSIMELFESEIQKPKCITERLARWGMQLLKKIKPDSNHIVKIIKLAYKSQKRTSSKFTFSWTAI